jgi:chromosome segregation ATPase
MNKFYKNLAVTFFGVAGLCAIATSIIQNNLNNNYLKKELINKDYKISILTYEKNKLLDEGLKKSQKNQDVVKGLIKKEDSLWLYNDYLKFEYANLNYNHKELTKEYNNLEYNFNNLVREELGLIYEINNLENERNFYKNRINSLDSVLKNCDCYYEGVSVPENLAAK